MNHICYCAYKVYGIKHNDRLRAVGHTYGNFVSDADSYCFKCSCTDFNTLCELFIGGFFAHKNICGVVGILFSYFFHSFPHAAFLIIKVERDIAIVF